MSQGNEADAVVQWLYGVFTGDGTLAALTSTRVFDGVAPQGTQAPWISYSQLTGVDTDSVGGTGRVLSNMLWMITAVTEGSSYEPVRLAAARMDVLIHGARNQVVSAGTVHGCRRTQAVRQGFLEQGVQYRRLGGIYRFFVQ